MKNSLLVRIRRLGGGSIDGAMNRARFNFDGKDAFFNTPYEQTTYTLTGFDTSINITPSMDAGAYTLTGNDANTGASLTFSADTGSYDFTGNNNIIDAGLVVNPDLGSYTLTGFANQLFITRAAIGADLATYVVTGNDATIVQSVIVSLESGSYTLTGNTIAMDIEIPAALGTYTLTGNDATFTVGGTAPNNSLVTSAGSDFILTADGDYIIVEVA